MRLLLRPINLLLLLGPLGIASALNLLEWGEGSTFILLALAIIPLAGLIASFTDAIADRVGDRVGGLLEATFGNSAFIIINILYLLQGSGNYDLIRASIAGAIITNTLFVLGVGFFLGAIRGKRQTFNPDLGTNYSKLLTLTVVALILPAVGENFTKNLTLSDPGMVSLITSVVLFSIYVAYLLFDIFHIRDYSFKPEPAAANPAAKTAITRKKPEITAETAPIVEYRVEQEQATEKRMTALGARSERAKELNLSPAVAIIGLALALAATVFLSEHLVQVTEAVTKGKAHFVIGPLDLGSAPFSETFVGLIIIPLIGTAAEHLSAIRSAIDGRTEITVAVTAGAAIQVALLATPIFVVASYFISPGQPFGLIFNTLELAVFGLAAFLFYLVTEDGEGTWLEGIQLFAFYLIFAGVAFFLR